MKNQKIGSREYKIMLNAKKFQGDEGDVKKEAKRFWKDFKSSIKHLVFDTDGSLKKIEKRRSVAFYDTESRILRNSDYVFRARVDLKNGDREVTLKFRHSDRYIVQDRDMQSVTPSISKTKFEEDIKSPFVSLFSNSTKQSIGPEQEFDELGDIMKLYPGLEEKLTHQDKSAPIRRVGDFTAKELVITGADFQIGASPKAEAECALIVWYDDADPHEKPLLVEFSFRYGNDDEQYDGKLCEIAYAVFQELQNSKWVNPESQTKTAYVYDL